MDNHNFYRVQKIAKELKKIFARDNFKYDVGTEDYIIRSVEEARRVFYEAQQPSSPAFTETTRLSKFESVDAAITWITEHGCQTTEGQKRQVQQLWDTCQAHAAKDSDEIPYLLDYEITVSAKKNRKARVYFSRKMIEPRSTTPPGTAVSDLERNQ